MVDRIKSLMDYFQLSPAQFADRIRVQRSALSHVLSGRNNPSLDFILKVKGAFPTISLDWLTLGHGNRFIVNEDVVRPQASDSLESDLEPNATAQKIEQGPLLAFEQPLAEKAKTIQVKDPNLVRSEGTVQYGVGIEKKEKLQKILLLYEDGSFSVYTPKK